VWALLLEGTHPGLATDVIYVAGDRVVTDPLCKPFSMGRNMFCVHSKKRMNDVPALKEEKQRTNRRTLSAMLKALKEARARPPWCRFPWELWRVAYVVTHMCAATACHVHVMLVMQSLGLVRHQTWSVVPCRGSDRPRATSARPAHAARRAGRQAAVGGAQRRARPARRGRPVAAARV